jgi:precorrin-2 dehydrogenase/sirohydrochlorin ferrochelatase
MFPITLQLKNKQIIIIGGGVVASRRIQSFLTEQAKVTVVSPVLSEPLQQLFTEGAFTWKNRPFHESDVQDAFIVIAATNSREVNAHIGLCCHENQLVNIADDPQKSSFHFPATVQRGLLNIAVSTSGASPTLSKKIRDDIAEQFTDDFIEYITFVKDARNKIIHSGMQPVRKKLLLQQLIEEPLQTVKEQEQFLSSL